MNKIFLSHSSKDTLIAEAFKNYLFNIGVDIDKDLYFTSNNDTGIPLGNDVLNDIQYELINAKIVILLLSQNYYKSPYCMNEMGAIWIQKKPFIPFVLPDIENKAMVGVISNNKQYGVISKEVLNTFYDKYIKEVFTTRIRPTNEIEKARDAFINIATNPLLQMSKSEFTFSDKPISPPIKADIVSEPTIGFVPSSTNSIDTLVESGFSDAEKLFVKYIIDTERVKFMCGWQENNEIEKIKVWEELTGLHSSNSFNYFTGPLSEKYSNVLQKFEIRKLIEVSATTSGGNPKEYKLREGVYEQISTIDINSRQILNELVNRILDERADDIPF